MRDLFKVLAALRITVSLSGPEIKTQLKCELTNDPVGLSYFMSL